MKIQAYRCTWNAGWMQYHDDTDPLPEKWDDEPPDETEAMVLLSDADHQIDTLKRQLSIATRQWTTWKEQACELNDRLQKYEPGSTMVLNTAVPNV